MKLVWFKCEDGSTLRAMEEYFTERREAGDSIFKEIPFIATTDSIELGSTEDLIKFLEDLAEGLKRG